MRPFPCAPRPLSCRSTTLVAVPVQYNLTSYLIYPAFPPLTWVAATDVERKAVCRCPPPKPKVGRHTCALPLVAGLARAAGCIFHPGALGTLVCAPQDWLLHAWHCALPPRPPAPCPATAPGGGGPRPAHAPDPSRRGARGTPHCSHPQAPRGGPRGEALALALPQASARG